MALLAYIALPILACVQKTKTSCMGITSVYLAMEGKTQKEAEGVCDFHRQIGFTNK
ncbi:hypothetical protein [Ectobacillus funiculus]|uniref:hypothetical protein n=1 Tax=Ectobacillus funiculus TaxID=137993 RepID=UPI00196B1CA2|nr:hypothetical protein [Ectobacillus funiculus]